MTSLRLPADAAVGTHTRSNPIESPHSWYVRLTDCDIYIGKGLEERESKELWWANGLSIFVGKWRNVGLTSYQISEVLLFLVSCLFVLTSLHSKALWPNFTCLYMFFIASGITSLETAPHRFPATHQRCLRGLLPMYHTWPWRWWLVMYDRITGFRDLWLVPWSCKPSSHPHCSWRLLQYLATWWYLYRSALDDTCMGHLWSPYEHVADLKQLKHKAWFPVLWKRAAMAKRQIQAWDILKCFKRCFAQSHKAKVPHLPRFTVIGSPAAFCFALAGSQVVQQCNDK